MSIYQYFVILLSLKNFLHATVAKVGGQELLETFLINIKLLKSFSAKWKTKRFSPEVIFSTPLHTVIVK